MSRTSILATVAGIVLLAASAASVAAQSKPHLGATGVVLVANQKGASASLIDLKDGSAIEIPVGDGPHETAISHDGRTGAVSIYGTQPAGNRIAIIDLKSAKVTKHIDLGTYTRPHGLAFLAGDDKLVATSESTRNVVIVDLKTGTVEAVPTNSRGSHMLAVPLNGKTLFTANVADGSITEIDLATKAFVKSYPIGATQTEGVSISPDGRYVWVGSNNGGTVSVFDNTTKSVVATIPGVGMPYRLGVSPDGRTAIVADPPGGKLSIVDAKTWKIVGTITLDGAPEGIAFTSDSRNAFITLNAGNGVSMIDIAGLKELRRFQVGAAPDGIAYTPVGR